MSKGSRSGTLPQNAPSRPLPCCCSPLHALQHPTKELQQPHLDHAPACRVRLTGDQGQSQANEHQRSHGVAAEDSKNLCSRRRSCCSPSLL